MKITDTGKLTIAFHSLFLQHYVQRHLFYADVRLSACGGKRPDGKC
jgi:hypothetical protein